MAALLLRRAALWRNHRPEAGPRWSRTTSPWAGSHRKGLLSSQRSDHGALNGTAAASTAGYKPEPWEEMYVTDPIDPAEPTFGKILIANRGEIACRIIRTCRKMGIKTVAVHSVADAGSLFVKMADEAVNIGPPPARESYLVMEKILRAVQETGAEAVHPGYGFLSENTVFVAELEKAGVTFIGPNSNAIKQLGDKLMSKKIAKEAKVNGIPGFDGVVKDADHCVELSREITYPVMIKASAGGGGKGMRVANNDDEAREAFKLCSQEGAASFGDDRMLVEKFVFKPRHVEIQVLGDKHGNAVYLNERECSIQRRNQKVIEEAPSPYLDEKIREAMGRQAVSLAKNIKYDSAGTVEFLLDADKKFYFLEMNTRLQVEHPITECITGVDLVHQMIRSAYGHKLKIRQEDVPIRGWAMECRVYAEDPFKNFGSPSIGRLYKYEEPTGAGIRCDSGIEEGSEISVHYDPMICKLTTYGSSRNEVIRTAVGALDHYVIRGVTHNIPLLRDILTEERFLSGDFTTNYLPETYPDGFKGATLTPVEKTHLAGIAAVMHFKLEARSRNILNDHLARNSRSGIKNLNLRIQIKGHHQKADSDGSCIGDDIIMVSLHRDRNAFVVKTRSHLDDSTQEHEEEMTIEDDFSLADSVIVAKIRDGHGALSPSAVQLKDKDPNGNLQIRYKGTYLNISVLPSRAANLIQYMREKPKLDLSKVILSPMPGVVKSVSAIVGQLIGDGTECCVVEAMKMQNSMKTTVGGKVKAVNVSPGDTVEEDQVLIELE